MDDTQYNRLEDKLDKLTEKNVESAAAIKAQLTAQDTKMEIWEKQLFGNGQPGILERLGKRLARLERVVALATGGGIVLLWILEHYR